MFHNKSNIKSYVVLGQSDIKVKTIYFSWLFLFVYFLNMAYWGDLVGCLIVGIILVTLTLPILSTLIWFLLSVIFRILSLTHWVDLNGAIKFIDALALNITKYWAMAVMACIVYGIGGFLLVSGILVLLFFLSLPTENDRWIVLGVHCFFAVVALAYCAIAEWSLVARVFVLLILWDFLHAGVIAWRWYHHGERPFVNVFTRDNTGNLSGSQNNV